MTEASKAVQLKAACREWGLAVSGSKPDLWERLQDEVREVRGRSAAPGNECGAMMPSDPPRRSLSASCLSFERSTSATPGCRCRTARRVAKTAPRPSTAS